MDAIDTLLEQSSDYSPTRTSSVGFLRSLQAFLDRNQIDFIGQYQMRVEPGNDNTATFLVTGQIDNRVAFEWAWPQVGPVGDAAAQDGNGAGMDSDGGSGSLSGPFHERGAQTTEDALGQMSLFKSNGNMTASLTCSNTTFPAISSFGSDSLLNIQTKSFGTESHEGQNLAASPFFDSMNPTLTDFLSTDYFHANSTECVFPGYHGNTPSRLDTDGDISTSPTPSTSAGPVSIVQCKDARKRSNDKEPRPYKRRKSVGPWDDTTELMIKSLSQNMLCEDFYILLESELPRWTREGLWNEKTTTTTTAPEDSLPSPPPSSASSLTSYSKLERAYLAVCQLDSRMSTDLVRNRMALIQLHLEYTETHKQRRQASSGDRATSTRGRGEASHVIDHILKNIHEGWEALDQRRRTELRVRFHDRKKYGKRWAQIATALGPGILLICSTKLANAVRSTVITKRMLESVIETVCALESSTVKIIRIVSPLAECLLKNERFDQFDVDDILREIRCLSLNPMKD
ncbi:hypothetical protein LZ31DRAFT_550723 [Colletotrichum somersetense]|nr:hypothetical protein LZ31DRAFT_550723 [Colletotrichum somersetense]